MLFEQQNLSVGGCVHIFKNDMFKYRDSYRFGPILFNWNRREGKAVSIHAVKFCKD
jgi:hypothetical protein